MIGVFDSGIGGLTVFKQIAQRYPALDIVYLGDTARVPYGTKSPETVVRYSFEAAHFLGRHGIELLVVACNTSSALALEALQRELPIPTIGVIHAGARRAARVTRSGRIGVIGTPATIRSGAYPAAIVAEAERFEGPRRDDGDAAGRSRTGLDPKSSIATSPRAISPDRGPIAPTSSISDFDRAHVHARGVHVVSAACPLFVPLAEEGWTDNAVARETARIYLEPLRREGVDTLVLGCTHYPILKGAIAEIMGPQVALVDSAEPAAEEAGERLALSGLSVAEGEGTRRFFVTDNWERFREVGARFLGHSIDRLEQVDIVGS